MLVFDRSTYGTVPYVGLAINKEGDDKIKHANRAPRAVLVSALLITLLTACEPVTPTPSPEILVGQWSNADRGGIDFRADQTFSAIDIPAQLKNLDGPADEVLSESGTWAIGSRTAGGRPTIVLTFTSNATWDASLIALDPWWDDLRLFFELGDPDSGVRYELEKN